MDDGGKALVMQILKSFISQHVNSHVTHLHIMAIFLRMVSCLFDELPHLHQYPDEALAVTAVLFGKNSLEWI